MRKFAVRAAQLETITSDERAAIVAARDQDYEEGVRLLYSVLWGQLFRQGMPWWNPAARVHAATQRSVERWLLTA